jgi:Reverse transcriptase (RNA-dependent DNA polymerase)
MASLPSNMTKIVIILDKPGDWYEWLSIVKSLTTDKAILKLIDPDSKEESTLNEPTKPTPSNVKAGAISPLAFDPKEWEYYKVLRDDYKSDLMEYRRRQAILDSIKAHIFVTVSRVNLSFISDLETPYQILSALQKRVAPTPRAREIELSRVYQDLKQAPKAQGVDIWLQRWEKTFTEATKLNLPDVLGDRATYDFLIAVKALDSEFSSSHEVDIENRLEKKEALPTLYNIVERYRNHLRLHRAVSKSSSHSAFATFQNEAPTATEEQSLLTCVCGEKHLYKNCLYLNEQIRTADWSPNPNTQKMVERKLIHKPWIKEKALKAFQRDQQPPTSLLRSTSTPKSSKLPQMKKKEDKALEDTQSPSSAYALGVFSEGRSNYRLQRCWILDSGADIHVCNDRSRFQFERAAGPKDILYAGAATYQIEAFGTVDLTVQLPRGTDKIRLLNVALVPGFLTNVAALCRFMDKDVHWNTKKRLLFKDDKTICLLSKVDDHWVLEDSSPSSSAVFATSTAPRPAHKATASTWHDIMGHCSSEAIGHLETATVGTKIEGRGTDTAACEPCRLSKARQIISRRTGKEDPASAPLARVAYDLIDMGEAYNGHKWASHFQCNYTTMDFIYTHASKDQAVEVIKEFINMAQRRYSYDIRYIHSDGERSLGKKFDDVIASYGISAERSAPYTPAQNGAAERSGGVMIMKARCIRIRANLPSSLWPEAIQAAGYLNNRTPKKQLGWKTPFEALTKQIPNLSHLHVYGCRAYPLLHNIPRRQKLEPRAQIGYLVGYDSTNIYRIWIPSKNRVERVRDVTFDEMLFYSPMDPELALLLREEASQAMEIADRPVFITTNTEFEEEYLADGFNDYLSIDIDDSNAPSTSDSAKTTPDSSSSGQLLTPEPTPEPIAFDSNLTANDDRLNIVPGPSTPSETLALAPTANFDAQNILPEGSKRVRNSTRKAAYAIALTQLPELSSFHAAFATGLQPDSTLRKLSRHRDTLPEPPRTWRQLQRHPFAAEFEQAARAEIQGLEKRGTYKYVQKGPTTAKALPLLWVFTYKFDSDGYLLKFKARLCVRGDLQVTEQDTYAATLAARTFRALLAIAAAFDLEIRQYDVINAFTNSELNEEIYCQAPEGFDREGHCWLLLRALYGLKQSPLLWHTDFTAAVEEIGLQAIPSVNCLMANHQLTLLFYVDDIVILCAKKNLYALEEFEKSLFKRFEMRSLGEIQWFLGIRVIRDRNARKIWLCQDSYISKIANKFHLAVDTIAPYTKTPLTSAELLPNEEKATFQQIYAYQQRVGSLNFASVITRPDISHAVSKLSQFLRNPSPAHLAASNRVISYLYQTRNLAIEYTGQATEPIFSCSSDAAFADDSLTRRSSDGYLFQLYGGAIDWRAGKQRTVTTSSTEAELLSLSFTAREVMWWKRFFAAIRFDSEQDVSIACDNIQTIRILTKEAPKLDSKLRHIDIHQHWLRQEVQTKRIALQWLPTADMPADGLTKQLPSQKHATFIEQLNLVKIAPR